jgi:RNA polymerase sigma-70 factor (ECF subfamily)
MNGVEDDRKDVIEAARAGEGWAIEELFRAHQGALLTYLGSRLGNRADDVASQTWLEVARSLPKYRGGPDGFRAWLFSIARHRLTDEVRRSYRRVPTVQDADEERAGAPDPEDQVIQLDESSEAARRIRDLLPADQADVVLLRIVAGLSVEETAKLIGKRSGHVRVLQHRALARLAQHLTDDGHL